MVPDPIAPFNIILGVGKRILIIFLYLCPLKAGEAAALLCAYTRESIKIKQ